MPQATLGREASDGTVLAILSTSGDSAVHQLRAGEALSAVLLRATQIGLATDPISQPLEVARTRAELRSHVARRTVGATTPAPPRVGLRATGLPDAPHAPTPAVPASCRPAPADATVGGRRAGAALADVREGGQLLATRTDYLPAGQAEAQRALQDHVTPFPFGCGTRVRGGPGGGAGRLGRHVSELYRPVDDVPLAAASLSRVHRAHRCDGTAVAVKVRRPQASEQVDADPALRRIVAHSLQLRG